LFGTRDDQGALQEAPEPPRKDRVMLVVTTEVSGQEIPDTSGYFLYETCKSQEPNEVRIIAQLVSEEAAFRLSRMLNMD
jgi:hypothetical protein